MAADKKYIMYLTGQHPSPPSDPAMVKDITHVALSFLSPGAFNNATANATTADAYGLFTSVDKVRGQFAQGTKVMVAIGGWGDTEGFSVAARNESSRKRWAENVKGMVEGLGVDGVDIDWEYPGGNGEDYKQTPNSQKAWEIAAYPKLLSELRSALGPDKLLSAAVPGRTQDMLAFTPDTLPAILPSIDFLNIMTYDLMNRRDGTTRHHTGLALSLRAVNAYLDAGLPAEKANLGFAFYVRWFKTDPEKGGCDKEPLGCGTVVMEDPETGADLGKAGAFAWNDEVPEELKASFQRAKDGGKYDEYRPADELEVDGPGTGGYYYWDKEENIFWSWDTAQAIEKKMAPIVGDKKLGGVFAWELGGDGPGFEHLKALTEGVKALEGDGKEGLGNGKGMMLDTLVFYSVVLGVGGWLVRGLW
ncbi:hypothetical protein FQN53_009470 [Emmonsiellopsis sp. PD_33]|nr:hypothetical protein FQN53_009470 [Emmonsiellopsis sp. PD_33]